MSKWKLIIESAEKMKKDACSRNRNSDTEMSNSYRKENNINIIILTLKFMCLKKCMCDEERLMLG